MDSLKNLILQENNGKALPEKRYLQIQKAVWNSQDLSKRAYTEEQAEKEHYYCCHPKLTVESSHFLLLILNWDEIAQFFGLQWPSPRIT